MIYSNILSAIFGNHWYASAEYMDAVLQVANNIFAGKDFFAQLERQQLQIEQEAAIQGAVVVGRTGTRGNDVQLTTNGTAVVPITGIIAPKASAIGMCMNGTSMDMLAKRANELAVNADVERVVLNINSGGGSVLGVPEAARAIRELAKIKPVTAYFNYIGASAAYFLAAAAGKRVVTDSSITGSIGVYTIVASQSEKLKKEGIDARIIRRGTFKAMPNGVEPFSAQQEGLDRVEADVEKHYRVFVNAIQNYLGISMEQAEKLADGTVTTGLAGIESGLADIEGTLEAVISGEIQADVVGTPSIVVTVPEKVEEIEASLDFVEGAPSEERAEEIAASLPSEDIVEESVDSPAVSNETEIAKLKLQVELLSTQLENTEADISVSAETLEREKILALIETAVEDGRIAPMRAETITESALKVGLETFTEILGAVPKQPVLEDLSNAPKQRIENPYVAAEKLDENAPATDAEVEMFSRIPALKKRYGL